MTSRCPPFDKGELASAPTPDSTDLRDLVENAGDLVQSVDMEGRFLLVNRAWRDTLGYAPEQIAELRLMDVIRPDHHESCGQMYAKLLVEGELPPVETVFVARDGREIEVEGRVTLRRDEAGRPLATRGIFRDVTEARATRRRLEDLLRTNRAIVDHAPSGIALYAASGRCLEANAALGRMVGASREALVEQDFRQLESWRRHGLTERAERCLRTGEPDTFETRIRTSFGVEACLRFRFAPVETEGEPHLLLLVEDVTADRAREAALVAQQRRLVELNEIAHELATETDMGRVLQTAVDRARELVRAEVGAIVRLDPETGRPCEIFPSRYPMDAVPPGTEVLGRGVLGRVASGRTVRSEDVRREPDFGGLPEWHPRLGPLLGVPVLDRGRTVALLLLARSEAAVPFEDDELGLAETIANLAATAMRIAAQIAELRTANDRLETLASTDALMGIGNRRSFDQAAEAMHALSTRYGLPYGIVMADLDRFKPYNDRLGHQAGDHVLATVAATLRKTIRASDAVFRYGGEEIVLLLPHQTSGGVAAAAERLRRCIEGLGLAHPDNPPAGVVTASFGCAAHDPTAADAAERSWRELLAEADAALYRAKAEGRNRVVAAELPAGAEREG